MGSRLPDQPLKQPGQLQAWSPGRCLPAWPWLQKAGPQPPHPQAGAPPAPADKNPQLHRLCGSGASKLPVLWSPSAHKYNKDKKTDDLTCIAREVTMPQNFLARNPPTREICQGVGNGAPHARQLGWLCRQSRRPPQPVPGQCPWRCLSPLRTQAPLLYYHNYPTLALAWKVGGGRTRILSSAALLSTVPAKHKVRLL